MVLDKTLESPLDSKEIKPVNPKGNQPWIFIGRTDVEAEASILWLPDVKSQLIGKDSDAGKDWGWEEKEVTEDEMVGWHHWLNGHEFGQNLGDSGRQGSLVCCSPWDRKVRHDWATQQQETPLCIKNLVCPIKMLRPAPEDNYHLLDDIRFAVFKDHFATARVVWLEGIKIRI